MSQPIAPQHPAVNVFTATIGTYYIISDSHRAHRYHHQFATGAATHR